MLGIKHLWLNLVSSEGKRAGLVGDGGKHIPGHKQ